MRKMRSGERTTIKHSNYIGIAGSMAALLGLFLPYLPGVSFFRSLEGLPAQALAPILTFFLALAAVLYALGREVLLRVIILCLFFCGAAVSCLCGHKLRIASCSASAAQRRMAAPFRIGGSGGGDFPSHGLAGKKPGIRP